MKKLKSLISFVIVFYTCESPDNTVNFVLENFEKGAVIRTIGTNGDYNFYDQSNSIFELEFEEHDAENGDLMENVEVYISVDGSAEILYKTIQPTEFSIGPTGLPRTILRIPLTDVENQIGFIGGSTVKIRLKLNLSNGKSYSEDEVTGSMTGSYFSSPFVYNKIVLCNVVDGSAIPGVYTIKMQDSYGDGWQDSRLKLTVDGQVYFFAIPSPYASGVEINKTLEAYTGDDNSGSSTVTIPSNASNMKWEWIVGRYPEETSYTISYTKLDGSRGQDSFNEANGPGGEKILSICQ